MKNIILQSVILTLFMAGHSALPALAQKAGATIKVFDKKTGKERSSGELIVRFDERTGETTQLVMGRGQVGKYDNVRFLKRSLLQDGNPLKPVLSEATYYDKKDKVVGGFLIQYDYDKRLATFIRYKEGKKEQSRHEFLIEGPICDAQNMPLFLEKYLLLHESLMASYFYLLSPEPRLYKVNIVYRGSGPVVIGAETMPAKKIQLIADMGPMTNFVANFLPKTYLWFAPSKPYRWLKYEGLEEGPDSANVIVEVARPQEK